MMTVSASRETLHAVDIFSEHEDNQLLRLTIEVFLRVRAAWGSIEEIRKTVYMTIMARGIDRTIPSRRNNPNGNALANNGRNQPNRVDSLHNPDPRGSS
jgi:hypothetical protein